MPKEQIAPVTLHSVTFFKRVTGAIRSHRSLQKSECGRITHFVLYKRVIVSDSLRSLMTEEQREQFTLFHKRIAISLFCLQKTSDSFEKLMGEFPTEALKIVTINIKTYLCTLKE